MKAIEKKVAARYQNAAEFIETCSAFFPRLMTTVTARVVRRIDRKAENSFGQRPHHDHRSGSPSRAQPGRIILAIVAVAR